MGRKYPLRSALTLGLAIIMLVGSNIFLPCVLSVGMADVAVGSQDATSRQRLVLQQSFENESVGATPEGWVVNPSKSGSFTVDNDTAYTGKKSAKFVDNSSTDVVTAFRYFSQQNGTIVVSFSVDMPYNTGNQTGLEISVDDGSFNGSNIIFSDGTIQYFDGVKGLQTLRCSYVANRWYRIKFIMDIPHHVYNIHIDDHLEASNARFNGTVTWIQRMAITEFNVSHTNDHGPLRSLGYIDDIEVRQGMNVPADFPTIQAAVNEASPGDLIYINGSRIYFENIIIPPNKNGITLEGQDSASTIIDGKFNMTAPFCVFLNGCSNVTISDLTLRNSWKGGAQINITGSGNNIIDNVIIGGLGDGIRVAGSNTTITDNLIQDNPVGIDMVSGQGSLVLNNTILNNTVVGLRCGKGASGNLIYRNRFVKNYQQALDNGTSNMWNSSYPYAPVNETGGGNYWSDFTNCTDIYAGPNQDIGPNCTIPSPDGICDQPYQINGTVSSLDNYPLFLIQIVTQYPQLTHANCALQVYDKSVQYDTNVTVSVTVLKYVQITNATLYVNYTYSNGTTGNMTLTRFSITGYIINFTIPSSRYNTTVRYIVRVLADGSDWLNSTNYPVPFVYLVDDLRGPQIGVPRPVPSPPDSNQTVGIYVIVTEPANASGVDKVFVSYLFNFTVWTAQMTKIVDDNYTVVIPAQPGGITLNFNVTAIDKAGNWDNSSSGSTYVENVGRLSVTSSSTVIPYDPCIVDFGAGSGDQIYTNNFTISNNDGPNDDWLMWNITYINGKPAWLNPLSATGGVLPGNQSVLIKVTVDTSKCVDPITGLRAPGLYVAVMQVSSNGTISQWGVVISIRVSDIIIDQSAVYPASSEWPNRVNLGSNQTVAFHAEWAINCLDATNGIVTIVGSSNYPAVTASVNNSGWATFEVPSPVAAKKVTFSVKAVQFGNVTSFWQTAQNRTICWERVNITLSMANNYVDVDSPAPISWTGSTYESDKTPFDGFVIFNDSLTRDHVDEATMSASSILDYAYPSVTVFESNSVDVIWDEIRIIQGGVSNTRTNSGQTEHVWFVAIYERENTLFKGENGTMFVNVTFGQDTSKVPLDWSFDDIWNWRKDFNYSSGTVTFQVSEVNDYVHHLTKIKDGVGPLNITWGEIVRPWWEAWWPTNSNTTMGSQSDPAPTAQTVQTASSNSYTVWAVVLLAIVVMSLALTLLLLMGSGKKSKSSTAKKKSAQANQSNTSASKS